MVTRPASSAGTQAAKARAIIGNMHLILTTASDNQVRGALQVGFGFL